MSFIRNGFSLKTGTATGVGPAGIVTGNSLQMGTSFLKVQNLSALITVDIETDTITLTGRWQASHDNTTFHDIAHGTQNAAGVVLGTGTGGADASIARIIPAPDAVYGYRFARLTLVVGVTTGTDNDTFSIAYNFRQMEPGADTD